MSRTMYATGLVGVVTAALMLATWLAPDPLAGQQPAAEAPPAAKAPPKFRGRLPAFYKGIVSDEQRDEIYKIQQKYAEQIHALQTQIMELVKQRDEQVEGVLTDEQRERLAQLVADAKAKRARPKTTDESADDQADQGEEPK